MALQTEELTAEAPTNDRRTPGRPSRSLVLTFVASMGLLLALHLYPIRTAAVRALLLLGLAEIWFLVLALAWRFKSLRLGWTILTAAAMVFLALPGRPANPDALRADYVRSLQSYMGTKYIWGGESHRGIDCSGLIRCGMIDAARDNGLSSLNPAMIRHSLSLWWRDCSAAELAQGYSGRTQMLKPAASLNLADYRILKPGDFAVTQDGVHTLAYIGDKTWIEADPGDGRVVRVTVPTSNPWFNHPVRLMRWKVLGD